MTIRADDVPVNVDEVAKCVTYSGAHVCNLYITSKEKMSITRIEKAFGKKMAEELRRSFGPDRQFVVIRFDVQDDGNLISDSDDEYRNNNYGTKYTYEGDNLDEDPYSLDTGAIKSLPNAIISSYHLSKRQIKTSDKILTGVDKEYVWFWEPERKEFIIYLNYSNGQKSDPYHSHFSLAESINSPIRFSSKDYRGYLYFNEGEDEGEIQMYSGDVDKMPHELKKKLMQFAKGDTQEIKQIDVPSGSSSELWKTKDKYRQLQEHLEKRKWMGFDEADPEFIKHLERKFASKKILILVASDNFCEQEYSITKKLFTERFGFDTITTSSKSQVNSDNGNIIKIDKNIKEIDALNYDSFFVIGGEGMIEYSKDKCAQKLLKTFVRQKKPIAMICHALLLAVESNLIRGKEVTCLPDIMAKIHRSKGIWTGMPIERDGLLFTALGTDDSENLAWTVSNFITESQNSIWKLAEEEDELAKLIREQEEELVGGEEVKTIEEERNELLKELKPKVETPPKDKPKDKPEDEPKDPKKKFKPPKKTLKDQIDGDFPDIEDMPDLDIETDISLDKNDAIEKLNKMLKESGEKYYMHLRSLNDKELGDYIILPNDIDEANNSAEEDYNMMVSYTMSIGNTPEANWDQFREYKKLSGEEDDELSSEEEEEMKESAIVSDKKEKRVAIPVFAKEKIEPPKDKTGNVIDHWPKIEMPEMSKKAAKIFYSKDVLTGPGLRKIFDNIGAWEALKKEPELLQSWVLPAIIMAIGYRFFEINSTQMGGKGIQFRHLEGGAPFSMLGDIDKETANRMTKGEINIEDLPQAKKYIQEIISLVTEYTNVYFSKDYADLDEDREKPIPIDAYIYSALKYEMTKRIANDNDYKEKRVPVCTICKGKYSKNKAIEPMEQVSRGIFSCPACARVARSFIDNDLSKIDQDISAVDGYLSKFDKKLSVLTLKIESSEDPEKIKKLEQKKEYLFEEANKYKVQRASLMPKRKEVQEKINTYKAQSIVPRWHTWCPNDTCPGKRVPLSSIDWNDETWGTPDGKDLKDKLKKTYGIIPPGEMEQDAAEINPRHQVSKTLSWIKRVPFVCPHDGVKFKMGEVEGQGDQGRAGFFWEPYTKLTWVPKSGTAQRGAMEELEQGNMVVNEAKNQLEAYQHLSSIGQQLARKQYHELFNSLRERAIDEKSGRIKPAPAKRKTAQYRNLYLYDTVKDFSFEDPVSYVAWMSGSLVYKKPTINKDNKSITNKNVVQRSLPYEKREDLIYQPLLQKWIDKMLLEGLKEVEGKRKDPFKIFGLNDWLVNPDADGIPSDGPGTYFISKIKNEVEAGPSGEYGFTCSLESKRKLTERQQSKGWDKRGPRLARVLNLWKLTDNDIKMLTERQREGKDPIPRSMAESIIDKTDKKSLHGNLLNHDYHDVGIDRNSPILTPGSHVLVNAMVMPGRTGWGPLGYIKSLEKNKEGYEFWDKFYELTVLHREDPKYWKEFSQKIETAKDYLYRAETIIDRELVKNKKKKGAFNISIRAEKDLDFPLSVRQPTNKEIST